MLDGVAFIDPKRSMIDIIQAVGRVIRKDKDRVDKLGTIVIPVFIDESEDADRVLSQSAFEPESCCRDRTGATQCGHENDLNS